MCWKCLFLSAYLKVGTWHPFMWHLEEGEHFGEGELYFIHPIKYNNFLFNFYITKRFIIICVFPSDIDL